MYNGQILENQYVIGIPTDPEELAVLLDTYSRDWAEVLHFLENVARRRGIILDTKLISEKIQDLQYHRHDGEDLEEDWGF